MTVLGQVLDALKSVLLLQEEVKRLGINTAKMAERLDALTTGVTRLEAHSDDALTRAQLAAQLAVAGELNPMKERLSRIELYRTRTRDAAEAIGRSTIAFLDRSGSRRAKSTQTVRPDAQRNEQLLKDSSWFDIPIVYTNGMRAILAMEKGSRGDRTFAEAFSAWEKK
jgi:hypothetical protein